MARIPVVLILTCLFFEKFEAIFDACERVITDKNYTEDMSLIPDTICSPTSSSLHALLRDRNETASKRLKLFSVLSTKLRLNVSFHGTCFHAIARVTQVAFESKPLFDVEFGINSRNSQSTSAPRNCNS